MKKTICIIITLLLLACACVLCGCNEHEHQFGPWSVSKEPTCTQDGEKTQFCECGEVNTQTISATGHSFGEWQDVTQASCTSEGTQQRTCTACGKTETQKIYAKGHTAGEWITDSEPTCTDSGSKHQVCSVCDKTINTDSIPANGHSEGNWITDREPTSMTTGSKHQICSACGTTLKTESIPKIEIEFTRFVAAENDECSVSVTKINPNYLLGYQLEFELENKSANKTYRFYISEIYINGVRCSGTLSEKVAPGKKSLEKLTLADSDDLLENGIGDFTDIELLVRVYDSDDWLADDVLDESIHVYPYGEENATKYVRQLKETDNVLIDNDYVTIIVTGYDHRAITGYIVNLFIVNKTTDTKIMFTTDEESINGLMISTYWSRSLTAGKSAFESISWSDSKLEGNGISTVETIELLFRAYDYNHWFEGDFANETVTLNPTTITE